MRPGNTCETLVSSISTVKFDQGLIVSTIRGAHVRDRQPLHEPLKLHVTPRRQHQMPVIGHDTIRQHRHRLRIQHVAEAAEKCQVVLLMTKQSHPPDPAVEDMIDHSAGSDASLSWHWGNCRSLIERYQEKAGLSRFILRFLLPGIKIPISECVE